MDYDEEDSGASGIIPEFGAIFMSNFETKKECFKRKMFALPSSKAEFVKHIKTGMVLFLFEVKKRQLFGVYQASSDGAIDICPHAFNYSGKRFPAQVRITSIWDCSPLSEEVFHDAISENYFSPNKFNLGLSEDQVRSLLFLFSSRKLNNKGPSCLLSEAVVGVTDKDRRYMELEYEEFNSAAFYDHHENSSARAKDDVVLVDDGVNIEGEVLRYYPEEDCFGKTRKLVYQDRSITNGVSGSGMYNHGTIWTFQDDSPKDSLDEVRLANDRRFLPVETVNENQVAKKLYHPLDVRAFDDYRFTRSRLLHEYDMHNVSRQTFASDRYRTSLDKTKHAIDDDTSLIDDSVQRDYASHDTVACNGSNQNLCRQARGVLTEDHERWINGNLLHGYCLDRDDSPIGTFEQSANLLHNSRKTAAARWPAINESETDFAKCSWENFSSGYLSRPLRRGHNIIFDKKYPIEEGRLIENMVDSNFCSDRLAKDAEYTASVEHQVVDDRRFRKNGRADNEEGSHMRTNPAILMDYPSFSHLKQNLPSFSDKSPEKGLNQPTVSHNFDLSCSTCDDAIITRVVTYSPRHPSFSLGFSASIQSNLNPSLVQRNNPVRGSLGNFYSPCQSRLPHCSLKLEKSSTPLDIAPEFGNKGFPTISSGCLRSLIPESTSFVNSNLPVHMNLDTSSPIKYRGSLFPKLSPQHTDPENIVGGQGLFTYPPKSRDHQFKSDGNLLTPSLDMEKEVPRHEMGMLGGKNFSCSQAKDLSTGICHPERDLASPKNQYIRKSSNTNCKELHKDSEAPHANSNVKRRSVFTRLTLKEESHVGREGNDIAFNHDGFCMDATADEVMEMLPQNGNLSKRKLRKSRFGGQPTHGEKVVIEIMSENALSEKKTQNHIKTNHSTMEKDKLNEASLATADSIDEDEVPKETRMVDFKRRSDRKKIGITVDSDTRNTVNFANEEVKSSTKTTLKRKKLVRPNFTKTGSAIDSMGGNETQHTPALVLDKDDKRRRGIAISISEAEMANDNTRRSDVLTSCAHQPINCNKTEHRNNLERKNVESQVLPATTPELKGYERANVNLQIGSMQALKVTTQQRSSGIQISAGGISAKDIDGTISHLNLPESSLQDFKVIAGCGNNIAEEKHLKTKKRKKKNRRSCKTDLESAH